jgi:hypothetical protein
MYSTNTPYRIGFDNENLRGSLDSEYGGGFHATTISLTNF